DIRRQHVGSKLEPGKFSVDATGQRFDREGFCQSRHTFQQYMTVSQQPDHQPFHQIGLADYHSPDLAKEWAHEGAGLLDLIVYCTYSSMHKPKIITVCGEKSSNLL